PLLDVGTCEQQATPASRRPSAPAGVCFYVPLGSFRAASLFQSKPRLDLGSRAGVAPLGPATRSGSIILPLRTVGLQTSLRLALLQYQRPVAQPNASAKNRACKARVSQKTQFSPKEPVPFARTAGGSVSPGRQW